LTILQIVHGAELWRATKRGGEVAAGRLGAGGDLGGRPAVAGARPRLDRQVQDAVSPSWHDRSSRRPGADRIDLVRRTIVRVMPSRPRPRVTRDSTRYHPATSACPSDEDASSRYVHAREAARRRERSAGPDRSRRSGRTFIRWEPPAAGFDVAPQGGHRTSIRSFQRNRRPDRREGGDPRERERAGIAATTSAVRRLLRTPVRRPGSARHEDVEAAPDVAR